MAVPVTIQSKRKRAMTLSTQGERYDLWRAWDDEIIVSGTGDKTIDGTGTNTSFDC